MSAMQGKRLFDQDQFFAFLDAFDPPKTNAGQCPA
uniref:Uncharacterized protein n=1 Tax=Rhodocyclus tenuis TaxID=1066 RepID=A0A840G8I1_RHOTE|nr:hypothetical protein [Rhodocyclus tenuis]